MATTTIGVTITSAKPLLKGKTAKEIDRWEGKIDAAFMMAFALLGEQTKYGVSDVNTQFDATKNLD